LENGIDIIPVFERKYTSFS